MKKIEPGDLIEKKLGKIFYLFLITNIRRQTQDLTVVSCLRLNTAHAMEMTYQIFMHDTEKRNWEIK